jgi:hypothetical protein
MADTSPIRRYDVAVVRSNLSMAHVFGLEAASEKCVAIEPGVAGQSGTDGLRQIEERGRAKAGRV